MPQMDVIGWIVVGLLAGALSGMVVGGRTARGCLPNIVVGVLGGLLGGFVARELLDVEQTVGFLSALIVAFFGAIVVRWLLDMSAR